MNDAKAAQEPSMEEILASIRRIISEEGNADSAAEKKAEPAPPPQAAPPAPPAAKIAEPAPQPEPEPPAAPEPAVAAKPEPVAEPEIEQAAPEEEDLVLTEVAEDEVVAEPEPEPEESSASMEPDIELAQAAPQSTAPTRPEPASGPDLGGDPLVSPDVAAASAASMAQLVARRTQTVVEVHSPGQGLLVETLVRQAVEPMLRDWLDANLQGIVERLVRREVERLSRRAELS